MTSSPAQHILIVEDDHNIAQIARMILELEGYVVSVAVNGSDGLERAREISPDLVISDVMMPDMDGLQFVSTLKSQSETSGIPVMMMSALTEDEHAQRGRDAGAEYYLKKPFESSQLLAAVKGVFAVAQRKQQLNQNQDSGF